MGTEIGAVAVARWGLVVLVALAAAAAAVIALGGVRSGIGPFTARLSLVGSLHGGTEVLLPPVGRLRLDTHTGPLTLRIAPEDVRIDEARELLARSDQPQQIVSELRSDITRGLGRLAVRVVALALIAAALASGVVFRDAAAVIVGLGATVVGLALAGGLAAATVRPQSLSQPTFSGLLAQAPALVGGVRDARSAFGAYSERLVQLTSNVTQLYGRVQALPAEGADATTRVLWVSDVHNNPGAYDLMRSLIGQFDLQAVIDTGDSTDLGTPVENAVHAAAGTLPVPYVWIRGNHDSLGTTQAFMAGLPNVRVLDDGAVTEVAGLRVAGIGDPRFTPVKRVQEEAGAARQELRRAGEQLAAAVTAAAGDGGRVDVALVHEPSMVPPLLGRVPLVLDGHVHERRSRRSEGTLELTQGSSGGAGLRALDGGRVRPLEMSVLHFDPATRELLAVDEITVGGIGEQRITLERRPASSYD